MDKKRVVRQGRKIPRYHPNYLESINSWPYNGSRPGTAYSRSAVQFRNELHALSPVPSHRPGTL